MPAIYSHFSLAPHFSEGSTISINFLNRFNGFLFTFYYPLFSTIVPQADSLRRTHNSVGFYYKIGCKCKILLFFSIFLLQLSVMTHTR